MDRVGSALLLFGLVLIGVGLARLACYGDDDAPKPQITSVVAPTSLQPTSLQPKCINACEQRFGRVRQDWWRYCETNDDVKCDSTDGPGNWSVDFKVADDQTTTCLCRIDSDTSAIW